MGNRRGERMASSAEEVTALVWNRAASKAAMETRIDAPGLIHDFLNAVSYVRKTTP